MRIGVTSSSFLLSFRWLWMHSNPSFDTQMSTLYNTPRFLGCVAHLFLSNLIHTELALRLIACYVFRRTWPFVLSPESLALTSVQTSSQMHLLNNCFGFPCLCLGISIYSVQLLQFQWQGYNARSKKKCMYALRKCIVRGEGTFSLTGSL